MKYLTLYQEDFRFNADWFAICDRLQVPRDSTIIDIELTKVAYTVLELEKNIITHYPFNEGDDYWTIDNGEVTWSCWDSVSEELHDLNPNKIYFTTELEAQNYLTQLNQIV